MGLTYKKAGVDIHYADSLIDRIKANVKTTYTKNVLTPIGGFASLVGFDKKYKQPIMVSGTDGVGTKLLLAKDMDIHDTIGIDLVAMCVNDVATTGAQPLFFLDYIGVGSLASIPYESIIRGVVKGCKLAGCSLVGGETAELPGMYGIGEYDLAGFSVGVAEKSELLPRKNIIPGDVVIGLASSGFHSNGYSLVRKVVAKAKLNLNKKYDLPRTLGEMLLTPTIIYVKTLQALVKKDLIKSAAHITGGGLIGNATRVIPAKTDIVFRKTDVAPRGIFTFIQKAGGIPDDDMVETFNNGIGMVVIASKSKADAVLRALKQLKASACVIGEMAKGTGEGFIR
ncbi:MAG: phosphoribosylformylglycinamidine cyclo-ligase [Spirochaetota bacterium]